MWANWGWGGAQIQVNRFNKDSKTYTQMIMQVKNIQELQKSKIWMWPQSKVPTTKNLINIMEQSMILCGNEELILIQGYSRSLGVSCTGWEGFLSGSLWQKGSDGLLCTLTIVHTDYCAHFTTLHTVYWLSIVHTAPDWILPLRISTLVPLTQ